VATNLATMTGALLRRAEDRGLERDRVLAACGLPPSALGDGNGRIASDADTAVWEQVGQLLADPDLGLDVAESWDAEAFGAVGVAAMRSKTVGDAITVGARLSRLIKDDYDVRITPLRRSVLVSVMLPRGHRPWARAIADSWLATYVVFANRWTGEAVRVTEAHFTHGAPRDTSAYERVLGDRLSFGRPTMAFVLDRAAWELPLRTARADAAMHFEARARASIEALGRLDSLSEVRAAVRRSLDEGDPRMARVARHLGTSARTLQRRLAAERMALRRIVDDARCSMALPLVAFSALPVEEIGARLGYADTKAFRRAFRRWTGLAPHEARRRD
jgi:AraC-like DNA-binding protein